MPKSSRIWTISRWPNSTESGLLPPDATLQVLDNFPDAEFPESGPIPRCRISRIWIIFTNANLQNLDVVSRQIFWTFSSDPLDIRSSGHLLDITSSGCQIFWTFRSSDPLFFLLPFFNLEMSFWPCFSFLFNIMWDKYVGKFWGMTHS